MITTNTLILFINSHKGLLLLKPTKARNKSQKWELPFSKIQTEQTNDLEKEAEKILWQQTRIPFKRIISTSKPIVYFTYEENSNQKLFILQLYSDKTIVQTNCFHVKHKWTSKQIKSNYSGLTNWLLKHIN